MLKTLERYQKCNYGPPETNISTREALVISVPLASLMKNLNGFVVEILEKINKENYFQADS